MWVHSLTHFSNKIYSCSLWALKTSFVCLFFLQSVAKDFEVEAMPTFVYMKGEEKVDKVVGAAKDEIVAKLEKHSQVASAWFGLSFSS